MNKLINLIGGNKVVAVVCGQWGDTGKGKIVDAFAEWADVFARGTGGNNAGHTVVENGVEWISHILPVGIRYDSKGKITVLGNGMVIDMNQLIKELNGLDKLGLTYNNLMISKDASVIAPWHISRDKSKNQSLKSGGIGSTGRGIGPCYGDKILRKGIKVSDLFKPEKLREKIELAKTRYPEQEIDTNEMMVELTKYNDKIVDYVKNTIPIMHKFVKEGKNILLEGAQGLLLSIEFGTDTYCTSSDCSVNSTAAGVGLKGVDIAFQTLKWPAMTRVGGGPFPTEIGGIDAENYCSEGLEHDIFFEVNKWLGMDLDLQRIRELQEKQRSGNINEIDMTELDRFAKNVKNYINENKDLVLGLVNSQDSMKQNVGVRLASFEYGATTKRPRRIGWVDAVAGRYAVGCNTKYIILTKVDCLAGANEFKICYGYDVDGKVLEDFDRDSDVLRKVKPVMKSYPSYDVVSGDFINLPTGLKQGIYDFEEFTGGRVVALSTGPEKEDMIIRGF